MDDTKKNWLPHLINAVPEKGYGKRLSTFTIALEGWRRGLKLKFYNEENEENKLRIKYSLRSEDNEHHFQSSMGDKVTEEAFMICDNKYLTKKYLLEAGVPTPQGKMFAAETSDEEILEYAQSIGFPLVLKPTDANGGRGVFSNLRNVDSLKEALKHVRYELGYYEIIIESYVPGDEYRIIVIEDKVIGALNRVPANVVGNGENTIRELVRNKNNERKNNPHLKSRMIKIDNDVIDLLYLNHYTLDTIPKEGEVVTLRLTSNLSTGGDSVDLTDKLTPELEKIAIEATNAIPGLGLGGIDMIVDSDNKSGMVIEVNTRPGLGGHLFPIEGTPRDLPKLIVDYYFPETKDIEKSNLFFDFDSILEPLKNRSAISIEVPKVSKGREFGRRFIINGNFDKRKYRNWIRRQAFRMNLNGYSDITENDEVEIVIVGLNSKVISDFKELCFKGPENTEVEVTDIIEHEWDLPVKLGFETKTKMLSQKEIKELEKEHRKIKKENERLIKRYSQIKNSRAWRVTYPVRRIIHSFKLAVRSVRNGNTDA